MPVERYLVHPEALRNMEVSDYLRGFDFRAGDAPTMAAEVDGDVRAPSPAPVSGATGHFAAGTVSSEPIAAVSSADSTSAMRAGPGRPRKHPDWPVVHLVEDIRRTLSCHTAEELIAGRPWTPRSMQALFQRHEQHLKNYDIKQLNRLVDRLAFELLDAGGNASIAQDVGVVAKRLGQHEKLPRFTSLEDIQRFLLRLEPPTRATIEVLEDLRFYLPRLQHLPTFGATSPDGRPRQAAGAISPSSSR